MRARKKLFRWLLSRASCAVLACAGLSLLLGPARATAAVTISPATLTFPSRTVGTTSGASVVTLTNNQTTALSITSVSVTGDFAQTNTCGASVAAGKKCTISVTFTPTLVGKRTGALTIADNASNSPQTASLTGTGSTAGLTSIAITPANPSIAAGVTEQFHATGTFTGGTTFDITDSVTWSSTKTTVATVSDVAGSQGLATALAAGATTVKAASGKVTGSTVLTVTTSGATLQSLAVTPTTSSIALGGTLQFTATGTYSDGSTQNNTTTANWTSSIQSVATVSNSAGKQGLASSVGVGTTVITATIGSITSSANLSVTAGGSGSTWTQGGPVARFEQSMIFDSVTQQMVIFGGQETSNSVNLKDVWLASTSLTGSQPLTYTQLLPTGNGPSARFGHVATYDQSSNRMTVFGGGEGLPGPCANDVWILDGANGQSGTATWLSVSPTGTAPSARVHPTGVYDAATNSLTVFGGSNCSSAFFNDVWVLSNANGEGGTSVWTQLSPSGTLPAARQNSTAIYDSTNHTMTIYGGDAGGSPFGDVWVLSNANGQGTPAWSKLAPTGTAPPPRTGHTAIYDSSSDRMTIFGGIDGATLLGDAWILTFANGLGGTPAWTALSVQGTAPVVQGHSAAYNQSLNSMYVFGGMGDGNKLQTGNHTFTLTEANGVQSGALWNIAGPPVRYLQSAFYDASTNGLFVYAGQHTVNINYGDYYEDSGVIGSSNVAWTKVTAASGTHPSARFGHTGLYDGASNRMMVFGGGTGSPNSCLNDYWILKQANKVGGTPTWVSVAPSGTAPAAREQQASAYDSATNSLIVFGGFNCTSTYFNDVWVLSNANDSGANPAWTHLAPSGTAPKARESGAAVYDPGTNSLIVFGGDAGMTTQFGDVWVLSHANGTGGTAAWSQITASNGGPSARTGQSAVYDSQNNRLIVYGGISGSVALSDTWVLANANGVGVATWTQLAPTVPGPPRYYHSAIYDASSNTMTIFGGIIMKIPLSPDASVFSLSGANGLQ